MDSGIQCILSKFVHDTKLCGMVKVLERRNDAIQVELDRLERWAYMNLIRFPGQVQSAAAGSGQSQMWIQVGWRGIESSPYENDLGMLVNAKLSMSWQCGLIAQEADHFLGCVTGSVASTICAKICPTMCVQFSNDVFKEVLLQIIYSSFVCFQIFLLNRCFSLFQCVRILPTKLKNLGMLVSFCQLRFTSKIR